MLESGKYLKALMLEPHMAELKTPSVPSLERGLILLETLAASKAGMGLARLAQRARLPKSSAHCLLLTLARCGYLERSDVTGRYMCSMKLVGLGKFALTGIKLRDIAQPWLIDLMNSTSLTVHLAIMEQRQAVLIEKLEPLTLSQKLGTWVEKRMEVHSTSVGKALIAHRSDQELDQLIMSQPLVKHNANTITSSARLKENLKMVRRIGYALDDEEDAVGVRCVGAPIFDRVGTVVGSVSAAGKTPQLLQDHLTGVADKVKKTAEKISRQLGFMSRSLEGPEA